MKMARKRALVFATSAVLCFYLMAVVNRSYSIRRDDALRPFEQTLYEGTSIKSVVVQTNSTVESRNMSTEIVHKAVTVKSSYKGVDINAYESTLARFSSPKKWIVLALADQGCVDMAISFFESSLRPFHIENYVIIGSDQKTCDILERYHINCYVYIEDKDANKASVYHSKDFLRKMNIRTFMILDALGLGYNVLHTDLDVYFMKNPFEEFFVESDTYDLAPLVDGSQVNKNAGFLFIRATKPSIDVYSASCHIAKTEPRTDDQQALNRAIKTVMAKGSLRLKDLPKEQFQCGKLYWDAKHRNFVEDKKCATCVVIHNNWIVSMEAKRYRFREMQLWESDIDGYYSDPDRKYLKFDNEVTLKDANKEDIEALQNALAIGEILNRTIILPRFHCKKRRCTILDYIKLRTFEQNFQYRENSFLTNRRVPKTIKDSMSNTMVIGSEKYVEISQRDTRKERDDLRVYQPLDSQRGANSEEIRKWFLDEKSSVLVFDNLVGAFSGFVDEKQEENFKQRLENGFKKGAYRQI